MSIVYTRCYLIAVGVALMHPQIASKIAEGATVGNG
jgi:hypothetical protein